MSDPASSGIIEDKFDLAGLEARLVEQEVLAGCPCCFYSYDPKLPGNWGIEVFMKGDFGDRFDSREPGRHGIVSRVASANVFVKGSGPWEEANHLFSAPNYCQTAGYSENDHFTCLIPDDTTHQYRTYYNYPDRDSVGHAMGKGDAPKGSTEELQFRSIHKDFPSYAQAFNHPAQGTRHLGVRVVFWPANEVKDMVSRGLTIRFEVKQENGNLIEASLDL